MRETNASFYGRRVVSVNFMWIVWTTSQGLSGNTNLDLIVIRGNGALLPDVNSISFVMHYL